MAAGPRIVSDRNSGAYGSTSVLHTLRMQQREDGLSFDQIVLSSASYFSASPGALKNDTTVLPRTLGTAVGPTAAHAFAAAGTYPVVLTVTDDAGASATGIATVTVLEEGNGAGVAGWGWNDNNWGALGPPIYFSTTGRQRLRIQQRQDGVFIDQIVLSAGAYADVRPGATKNDATAVPKTLGTASGATSSHTYKFPGVYPVRLTVTDNGGNKNSASTTADIT